MVRRLDVRSNLPSDEVVFFQAEGVIRDTSVTGVQTYALPIYSSGARGGSAQLYRERYAARHARKCPTPRSERRAVFASSRVAHTFLSNAELGSQCAGA